ncbi:TPA: hypothetical protein JG828_005093 [Vibrio parahaemolyticus]|nr:hypothetical protein [Vibrio parahaemolyticus]HAV1400368.1 hypothetical protein [Vibrio parahaemolyticus]
MNTQLQTTHLLHNAQHPLSIYCDGSAPDNQHGCLQGGVGVAVYDALGHCIQEYSSSVRRAGGVTSQRAELLALIIALLVAGHSGIKGNEHSDRLARQAAEGKM